MNTLSLAIIFLTIVLTHTQAKILRNNALMTAMMAQFHNDNTQSLEPTEYPRDRDANLHEIPGAGHKEPANQTPREAHKKLQGVLTVLQNVMCRNFPAIPCSLIMEDQTLRQLMERSIQQVNSKKPRQSATATTKYLTLFPIANSEGLVKSNAEYFRDGINSRNRRQKKNKAPKTMKNFWSHERFPKKKIKGFEESKRAELFTAHKKIRKFYPHKVKHKDKSANTKNFRDSEEKLSMSLEAPEMALDQDGVNKQLYAVAEDPPVWRIDYMKHGEPSLNMLDYDDRLKGKIIRAGPSVVVDEAVLQRASRRDVLHPDLLIRKKFTRTAPADESTD